MLFRPVASISARETTSTGCVDSVSMRAMREPVTTTVSSSSGPLLLSWATAPAENNNAAVPTLSASRTAVRTFLSVFVTRTIVYSPASLLN